MRNSRLIAPVIAAAAAATMAMPVAPAQAAETCHPPRYDTVYCACVAVGRIWVDLTGGDFYCER